MATNAGEDTIADVDAISTAAVNATVGMDATTATATKATNDADATDTDEVEELKNPQACFMGLPAELRVRIYGFLFSGDWVKEVKTDEAVEGATHATAAKADEVAATENGVAPMEGNVDAIREGLEDDESDNEVSSHAESEDNKPDDGETRDEHEVSIHNCFVAFNTASPQPTQVCACFGRLQPAILRTNSTIYNEAMPVFYASLEARGPLPHIDDLDGPDSADVWEDHISSLPAAGLRYIKKIALTHNMLGLGARIDPDDSQDLGDFAPMWRRIKGRMPQITGVRFSLNVDTYVYLGDFAFHQFAGVARLPNIRFVEIQLHARNDLFDGLKRINDQGESMEEFKKTFVRSIGCESKKLGKQVEVKATSGVSWLSDPMEGGE